MKVQFDTSLKIAGIGLVPWTRLGPELWFNNYKIASLYGWDIALADAPEVHALHDNSKDVKLPQLNSQALMNNAQFQKMLQDDFNEYSFLTYKPVTVPDAIRKQGMKFLSTNTALARNLENKAFFRNHFEPLGIRFPAYAVYDHQEVEKTEAFMATILAKYPEVVMQDSVLSGGKGTFMVHDTESFNYAIDSLKAHGLSDKVVVSERIANGRERTVQGVVTRHGVFIGPLQKQIVADPLLANLNVADGDKFCGAEISHSDEVAASYEEVKRQSMIIGNELQALGYRGIFGVDALVVPSGEVFVLEVNPRITGVTPLLTMLYRQDRDIPFYLLHILELMDQDYTITDFTSDVPAEGSLLMLHGQNTDIVHISESPRSGIYTPDLEYLKPAVRFEPDESAQVLVQQYTPAQFKVKPGGRIVSVFTNYPTLHTDDSLSDRTKKLVSGLSDMVKLEQL